jgi:hypothetical protein
VLTTPHCKKLIMVRNGKGICFGTWNVRSLYRSGLLLTVVRELARYKLDLVDVQEVRWEKGSTARAGDYTFFCGKGMKIINWGQGSSYTRE